MPKMFIHAPQDTFTADARAEIAAGLTELGIECERLLRTDKVRAGVWVYFVEHLPETVFRGGLPAPQPVVTLKAYTLKGGLDAASREKMIVDATAILGRHLPLADGLVPVYVVVLEVPETNWGMYGRPVHLAAMQLPLADA